MKDKLKEIVQHKRTEVVARKWAVPQRVMEREQRPSPARDFEAALRQSGMSIIAEFKRRSPSKGDLRLDADVRRIAETYAECGARAMSVLTDAKFFGGSETDLKAARAASGLPVIRKDFTIDEYQLHEARFIGADAVLLIVRILEDAQIRDYLAIAREIGLAALVEVHDEWELERAAESGASLIGVNNRNLDTFEVSLDTCLRLREMIPAGVASVAESGIHTRCDVERLERASFDAMLIGESLMTADLPGTRLAELLGAKP